MGCGDHALFVVLVALYNCIQRAPRLVRQDCGDVFSQSLFFGVARQQVSAIDENLVSLKWQKRSGCVSDRVKMGVDSLHCNRILCSVPVA